MIAVCPDCGRVAVKAEGYINSGRETLWRYPAVVPGPAGEVSDCRCPVCEKAASQKTDKQAHDRTLAEITATQAQMVKLTEALNASTERARQDAATPGT